MILGIDTSGLAPPDHAPAPSSSPSAPAPKHPKLRGTLVALERTVLTLLSVAVSILIPEFASVMAVLGSTFSFLLCIIGPVSAKVALAGGCGVWDGLLLATSSAMALWGTACAFMSAAPVP